VRIGSLPHYSFKMKVLIYITVWKRPEATEITYLGLDRVQKILKEEGIDSDVLVISSEDYHTKAAKKRGYKVIEVENFPVGNKMNLGMQKALEYKWDYLMEMGSNNLLSNMYIRAFAAACKEGFKCFGSGKFYALQSDKSKISIFNVRGRGTFGGVGRGFRRDILEAIENKKFWKEDINSGLDGSIWRNVIQPEVEKNKINVRRLVNNSYPSVLDLKTGEDINKHKGEINADIEFLLYWFPELKHWI